MHILARIIFAVSLLALSSVIAFPAAAQLTPAEQAGLNLGTDENYAFIDLGATILDWGSGPISGNVLLGLGLRASLLGGGNGGLTNGGELFLDNTVNISGSLQTMPTEVQVPTTTTQNAETVAQDVSNFASGLTATQTLSIVNGAAVAITGNGGLNVIDVGNFTNSPLTLDGTANDFFVFNVSGGVSFQNVSMTLNGVLASHILFNLTGAAGSVFTTSGADVLFGTFLATHGGQFEFSNLDLTGALINTDGNVQFFAGSQIPTFTPFTSVPEPGTFGLLGIGALALIGTCIIRSQRTFQYR